MNPFLKYILTFLVVFCVLYYGTFGFIGLAAPGGYYVPFFDHYLNYPAWLRASILTGSQGVLYLLGFHAYRPDQHLLVLPDGTAVRMVYACLGYGIMSFWAAFVLANKGTWKKKAAWIVGGLLAIWLINISRVSTLLLANSKHKTMPFGLDNHTWFNVCAYIMVFVMIWLYDRSFKEKSKQHVG